ncbi:MAG: hypothetical protein ACK5RL_05085 [Acidimicrobiales bacterium]
MRLMHRRSFKTMAAGLMGVALVAGACGSDNDTEASSDGGETASPLADYLGIGDVRSEDGQAQFIEMERSRQDFVQQCMAEEGFEYTPLDPNDYTGFVVTGDIEYGTPEWVETYGFGVSTLRFTTEQVGPDLVGVDLSALTTAENNPNLAAMESMSDSERAAYEKALYGDSIGIDESMTDEEAADASENIDFSTMGCEGRSYSEAEGANLVKFFTDFEQELSQMEERISSDPRMVEAGNEVNSCVAEQGLEYTSEEAFTEAVEPDLAAMGQGEPGAGATDPATADGVAADGTDPAAADEGDLSASYTLPELTAAEKERLGEIQAQEIELATAVEDCGGGSNLEELRREVSAEYEQEFMDEHADELGAYAP